MPKNRKKKEKSMAMRTMHYYWKELKANWKYNLPMLFLIPIGVFLSNYAGNWIISEVIDKLTSQTTAADQIWSEYGGLILLFTGTLVLSELVVWRVNMWILWRSEVVSMMNLHKLCFRVLSSKSMSFHNNNFGGSLVNYVNRFARGYEGLYDSIGWNLLPIICGFTFTITILGPKFPEFTILLMALSVIFMTVAWFSFKKVRDMNEKESTTSSQQTGQLADSITNIATVKSYGAEAVEQRLYWKRTRRWGNATFDLIRAILRRDIAFGSVLVLISAAMIVFLVYGNAWFGVSIGTLVLAITYATGLWGRLWDFNHVLRSINKAFGDATDMTKILDEADTVVDQPGAKPLVVTNGEVKFDKVDFTHTDSKDAVFNNLNLTIPAGQRVGVVGRSGSGKTTLTKLLLRFNDIQSGEISIDGQNIATVSQISLRENIAYVPQETTLFHRSIRDNIAYGRPEATDDEVIEAAKLANAWEFIKDLPKGLDTLTGERGVKLSGGQRQRVAIARAILKDAPILVLDEATASLDTESEKLIQEALSRLMKGRTSIIIAHRLSTVAELDRIVVLEQGKIVEDDTHENLVKKGGIYSKLWNRQTGTIE